VTTVEGVGLRAHSSPLVLVRAVSLSPSLRGGAEAGIDGIGLLSGYAAVTNEWTRISSVFEGDFVERIAPGAFMKTLLQDRARIRVLYAHGRDALVGDKPLGPLVTVRETARGLWYEAPLLDTAYNRELIPGLRAGLYGSSFRFSVTREQIVERPSPSGYNPLGLPERTVQELKLYELGPCTFPAYSGATAGVRSVSMTDLYYGALTRVSEQGVDTNG
jgi:HK97 family phage prohead protease